MTPGQNLHSFAEAAKHCDNPKAQAIFQWVGIGSALVLALGGMIHLYRDLTRPHHEWKPEPYPRQKHRELVDELDRHHRDGRGR